MESCIGVGYICNTRMLIQYDLKKNIRCYCRSVAELFTNPTFEEDLAKTGKDIKATGKLAWLIRWVLDL